MDPYNKRIVHDCNATRAQGRFSKVCALISNQLARFASTSTFSRSSRWLASLPHGALVSVACVAQPAAEHRRQTTLTMPGPMWREHRDGRPPAGPKLARRTQPDAAQCVGRAAPSNCVFVFRNDFRRM